MKQRIVSTKFWSDPWVMKNLNPLDRYLFLYFLTNEHTKISGIYEISIHTIAFDTGIEKETLVKAMLQRLEPKVYFMDEWIIFPNFPKHQSLKNPKIMAGIQAELALVPDEIYEKAIGYGYPIHRVSHLNSNSNTNINTNTTEQSSEEKLIGEIIFLFKEVNPSYKTFFNRKPQREAARRLLKEHGMEKLKSIIAYLPHSNGLKYAPTITSPYVLEAKIGDLLAWSKKQKDSGKKVNIAFV